MADKQPLNINFAQGIDQKSDPRQIPVGKFAMLNNSVFTKAGLLAKRNGFGSLTALPNATATFLTTFAGNLTAIGTNLEAYNQPSASWVDKGTFQPISLSTLPVGRSAFNQTQCDSIVSASGLICTVYTEVNNGVSAYKYVIQDSTTGQNIVEPAVIPVSSGVVTGSARVFILGGYFIIIFTNVISGTSHLQYIAISISNPSVVSAEADLAAAYISSTTLNWDGVVVGNKLFFAYNTTTGGQQVKISYLSTAFVVATPQSFAASIATIMSICADLTNPSSPIIYAAFYDLPSTTGKVIAVDQNLHQVMTATTIISSGTVLNVTCAAKSGVVTVAFEVSNAYTYDANINTNFLDKVSVTLPATVTTGTVGSTTTFLRSVGLASKAFLMNSTMYLLTAYDGKSSSAAAFQPTYFLVNISGDAIAKLAYQNGGGYLTLGLPQAQVVGTKVNIAYLFKDLIQSVNKTQGVTSASGVYSQLGINMVSMIFDSSTLSTAEIGNNLNLSGGFLYAYDGNTINEQNFHLYPDSVELTVAYTGSGGTMTDQQYFYQALYEWTDAQGNIFRSAPSIPTSITLVTPTNKTFASTDVVTATDQITVTAHGFTTGMAFTLTTSGGLPAPLALATTYYVIKVDANTIKVATSYANAIALTAINLTTQGSGTDTIHVSAGQASVTVNVPTARITYKSGVKIMIYRFSTAQQEYFQVTSISAPTLNNTAVDSVAFVDTQADSAIIGNSLIYTTGGVVEDTGAPACTALTLFDTRLWMIDAEDQNLLWYSKQIIEGTPVEMSDLFTYFVAPNAGVTGSTGPMKFIYPMDDKLIIFKSQSLYYINGTGPNNLGADSQYSQPIFITSTVGSVNLNSIVLTPYGLMFQSDKGIWILTRSLETKYIGSEVEDFNSYTITSAVAVPGTTEIRFTLNTGTILMYNYFYNQWGTFIFVNTPTVSSTIYRGLHTLLSSRGGLSQETPGVYLDSGNPVLMSFTTGWLHMAGLIGYQRFYRFFLLGSYFTPHRLQVSIAYDYNANPAQTIIINPINFSSKYGGDVYYGDGATYGGVADPLEWQIDPQKQKCEAFQLTINEYYDPSFGVAAGAGFNLSGLNLILGFKKGYAPIRATKTVG